MLDLLISDLWGLLINDLKKAYESDFNEITVAMISEGCAMSFSLNISVLNVLEDKIAISIDDDKNGNSISLSAAELTIDTREYDAENESIRYVLKSTGNNNNCWWVELHIFCI